MPRGAGEGLATCLLLPACCRAAPTPCAHASPAHDRYVFQGVHMLMSLASTADGVGRPW